VQVVVENPDDLRREVDHLPPEIRKRCLRRAQLHRHGREDMVVELHTKAAEARHEHVIGELELSLWRHATLLQRRLRRHDASTM
jgi:hypothetical protein